MLIARGETVGLGFANIREVYVYKPTRTSHPNVVDAPEDMVGWFRRHPYLRISEPESVTVGGIEGQRFDVTVEDPPEDYYGECGSECVDLLRLGGAYPVSLWEEDKAHFVVLRVKGETVVMGFVIPAAEFGERASEAQEVIDTVQWRG